MARLRLLEAIAVQEQNNPSNPVGWALQLAHAACVLLLLSSSSCSSSSSSSCSSRLPHVSIGSSFHCCFFLRPCATISWARACVRCLVPEKQHNNVQQSRSNSFKTRRFNMAAPSEQDMVAQANTIARQFAQHYYQTFDSNPPALAALYVSPPSLFIFYCCALAVLPALTFRHSNRIRSSASRASLTLVRRIFI